jgi:hypothetical protein
MPFNRAQAQHEIEQRNRLRKSASLPVLDIEAELKQLEQVQRETAFERFVDSSELYRRAMRRGVYRKRARDNGNFNSIDGMALTAMWQGSVRRPNRINSRLNCRANSVSWIEA